MSGLNCKKKGNSVQKQSRKNAWVKLSITEYLTTCTILLISTRALIRGPKEELAVISCRTTAFGIRAGDWHHTMPRNYSSENTFYRLFSFSEYKCGFLL